MTVALGIGFGIFHEMFGFGFGLQMLFSHGFCMYIIDIIASSGDCSQS